jgi:hypothetical protein
MKAVEKRNTSESCFGRTGKLMNRISKTGGGEGNALVNRMKTRNCMCVCV